MQDLRAQGWIVDYASMGEEPVADCDNDYTISIARSPFSLKNLQGVKDVKKLLAENNYDIVHCHTPMGGVVARAAAKKLWKQKIIKVLYTAHGFHFYKGAPLLNWLCYYPVEKYYSRFTDLMLTIVPEDQQLAAAKMYCPSEMINGVGIDLSRFMPLTAEQKSACRKKNGFTDEDFIITVVAECNKNKNQIMLLQQVSALAEKIPNLKVLLIGKETLPIARNYVEEHNLQSLVQFLGYRKDIPELTGMSNIAFSASIREGLGLNIIEGMACGVPPVASRNRGHRSLITDGETGFLFDLADSSDMVGKILWIHNHPEEAAVMGAKGVPLSAAYSVEIIRKQMMGYYQSLMK